MTKQAIQDSTLTALSNSFHNINDYKIIYYKSRVRLVQHPGTRDRSKQAHWHMAAGHAGCVEVG
jgi:hypothetical protein